MRATELYKDLRQSAAKHCRFYGDDIEADIRTIESARAAVVSRPECEGVKYVFYIGYRDCGTDGRKMARVRSHAPEVYGRPEDIYKEIGRIEMTPRGGAAEFDVSRYNKRQYRKIMQEV